MNNNEIKEKCSCKSEAPMPEGAERMETRKVYIPAVDVVDNGEESVLYADMPGVDESNIEITLEKNILTIKGKPEAQEFAGKENVYSEYGFGDFERSFTLSEAVDREKISAGIKDGVLTIKLPKAMPKTRKIPVATVAGE